MSEEIIQGQQRENDQPEHQQNKAEQEEEKLITAEPSPPEPGGPLRSTPRPGAPGASRLLVEVYGRVVRNLSTSFSPNQVLFNFTSYLVSFRIPSDTYFSYSNEFFKIICTQNTIQ